MAEQAGDSKKDLSEAKKDLSEAKKDLSEATGDSDPLPSTSGTTNVKTTEDSDDSDIEAPTSSVDDSERFRFVVKEWNALPSWALDIVAENCGICCNPVVELCMECQASETSTDCKECNVAWGVCNHTFHWHCVSPWLRSRQVCPSCNQEWEFHKYDK